MSLEDHPIASIFPLMSEVEFSNLCTDIKENGMREEIVMLDGKILDGRNRYRAAQKVGAKVLQKEHDGSDPVKFVLSLNLQRRMLSESQRAMVAAKIANIENGGDRKSDQSAERRTESITQPEAAAMLNVGLRSVQRAKVVLTHAPERVASVERGEISVTTVADQIKAPLPAPTPIPPPPPAPFVRPLAAPVLTPSQQARVEEAEKDSESLWTAKRAFRALSKKERAEFISWMNTARD